MLEARDVRGFWTERVAKYGIRTIGSVAKPFNFQLKVCKKRKKFIFSHCPRFLRTLDFGCGIGAFADCFEFYLGADINESVLTFAGKIHPEKNFILLKRLTFLHQTIALFRPELFFMVTVLQHNSDALVKKIFKNMARISQGVLFSFYENSQVETFNIKPRMPEDYINLLSESFKILTSQSFSHHTYGEKHSLTLVKAKSLWGLE